jgi:hypothetical protein
MACRYFRPLAPHPLLREIIALGATRAEKTGTEIKTRPALPGAFKFQIGWMKFLPLWLIPNLDHKGVKVDAGR